MSEFDLSSLSPRQRARFEREMEREQRFTDEAKEDLCRKAFGDCILRDEPMAPHTKFGAGGPADALVIVRHLDLLKEVVEFTVGKDIPHLFLGSGSSTLFKDGGFRGLVIKLGGELKGMIISHQDGEHVFVRVGGAALIEDVIEFARVNGLDWKPLGGLSGTMGGRIMARPSEYAQFIEEVQVIDRSLRELTLTRKALISDGKIRIPRSNAIVSVLLRFARAGGEASPTPDGLKSKISSEIEKRLEGVFREVGTQQAGAIIADAGLAGVRVGQVRVDQKDPNCFINEGTARARDATVLMGLVKDRVREKLGLNLESVIRIVGED